MANEIPDVKAAVWDLTVWAGMARDGTSLPSGNVVHGRQNLASLPEGSEEYAVITHLTSVRRGTSYEPYDPVGQVQEIRTHWLADFQIDFYSADVRKAFERASAFEAVASSAAGCERMAARGVNLIEAAGLRDTTGPVDSGVNVCRCQTVLQVEYETIVRLEQYGASDLDFHIENVDEHHPPKEL